jgi:hypothetical protein
MDSFGQGTKRKREKEEPTNPENAGNVDMHDTEPRKIVKVRKAAA